MGEMCILPSCEYQVISYGYFEAKITLICQIVKYDVIFVAILSNLWKLGIIITVHRVLKCLQLAYVGESYIFSMNNVSLILKFNHQQDMVIQKGHRGQ